MVGDWSYYHAMPRSQVHAARFGTRIVPPRQYRFGGGRFLLGQGTGLGQRTPRVRRAGLTGGSGWIIGAILLGLLILGSKK